MSLPLITTVPTTGQNPSNQYQTIQQNFNSIGGWATVDHIGYTSTSPAAGTHAQSTYAVKTSPGAQLDPISTVYTANGVSSSIAELYFINQNTTFNLSALKVFGNFTPGADGLIVPNMASNVATITQSLSGTVFTIALTTKAINSINAAVFIYINSFNTATKYTLTTSTLTITLNGANASLISFAILQT